LQDVTTNSLEQTGRKQRSWHVVTIIGLLLAVLIAVAIGLMLTGRNTPATQTPPPPAAAGPETILPPLPPVAPQAPPAEGATVATSELMYPGAETVMDMKTGRETLLELRTNDPLEKVVDWYLTKLKPAEIIRTPGREAILRSGKTNVIISKGRDNTDILLKQGL
jgi:hypothetical protein